MVIPLLILSFLAIAKTSHVIYIASKSKELEKAAKELGKNLPKFFAITRYPLLAVALFL
jgi:hypothetical protein